MKVENLKIRNWHKVIASFYYPTSNEVLNVGIVKIDFEIYSKNYLVGFWKIKKLKRTNV